MKITRVLAFSVLLPGSASAQQLQEYAVDAGHSIVEFSIGFAFSRVKGRFTHSKGTILYDSLRPERSSVTIVIDAKTIDTGWPHRDEHLRTSDFFDVEKYPTIIFQSERLTPTGAEGAWVASGTLTMHGVTKEIAIPFHFLQPPTRSPESNWMILNVAGALRVSRTDFGIAGGSTYNSWFNTARAATMADSVDITIELEGWSADARSQRPPPIEAALERITSGGIQAQIERLRSAQASDPKTFPRTLTGSDWVVRALIATGRLADAVALSKAMTELYPTAPRAWIAHGVALAVSGDARGAAQQYARAKEVFRPPVVDPNEKFPQDDDNWYYLDQFARTLLEWGRPTIAVAVARTVAEMYSGTARAHTTLGVALAESGDVSGATAAYAKALQLDAKETRALERRRRLRSTPYGT